MKFTIEIELTEEQLEVFKMIDWAQEEPKTPFDEDSRTFRNIEVRELADQGVIYNESDPHDGHEIMGLTRIGRYIKSKL